MAFIYRYKLGNGQKSDFDLIEYDERIRDEIKVHFRENLKDEPLVTSTYFEFKLYTSVERHVLANMGKRLAFVPRNKVGFRRMPQNLYMILYPKNLSEETFGRTFYYVEFFDCNVLDEEERFCEQAKEYAKSSLNENQEMIRKLSTDADNEGLRNAFYLDVMSSEIDAEFVEKWIGKIGTEPMVFNFKGSHRVEVDTEKTHSQHEDGYKANPDIIGLDKITDAFWLMENDRGVKTNEDKEDVLITTDIISVDYEKYEKVRELVDFDINKATQISSLESIQSTDKIKFTVHDVGQGLSTSLSKDDEPPFLFFDFGMGKRNAFFEPSDITGHITPGKSIILSHIHRDHWNRLTTEKAAYKCCWYIPNQERMLQFGHKCAEIIKYGGSVDIITDSIHFAKGELLCNKTSIQSPPSNANDSHKTGFALRINACVSGKLEGIVVSGDQMYDYIDARLFDDLRILVATHHGGSYGNGSVPQPMSAGENKIVYSYGHENKYEHPKTQPYCSSWKNEHHTPYDGDYSIYV